MVYLNVAIVTPNGLVYKNDKAGIVIVKTIEGDLGILPNHAPIIVPLAIDQVQVKSEVNGADQDVIAVSGGIMEVRENELTIIADSAEPSDEIDVQRAEFAKESAQKRIKQAKEIKDVDQLRRAEVELNRAINRINVSNK